MRRKGGIDRSKEERTDRWKGVLRMRRDDDHFSKGKKIKFTYTLLIVQLLCLVWLDPTQIGNVTKEI